MPLETFFQNETRTDRIYWTFERDNITYYVELERKGPWAEWYFEHVGQTEGAVLIMLFLIILITIFFWSMHYKFYRLAKQTSRNVDPVDKPYVPFNMYDLVEFKGYEWRRSHLPEPRIFVRDKPFRNRERNYRAITKVRKIVRTVLNIEKPHTRRTDPDLYREALWHRYLHPIPVETRIVALSMKGFQYGGECYEFKPILGVRKNSFFTYQMYGHNRCLVTRYHMGDQTYVAGFCIFIRNPFEWGAVYPAETIKELKESSEFCDDAVLFLLKIGLCSQKDYEADREKLRLEIQRKENYESSDEEEVKQPRQSEQLELPEQPEPKVVLTVLNEQKPLILKSKKSPVGSQPNLDYPEEEELDANPSMTPESLRGNMVPLASSEESSLLGSQVSLERKRGIQKNGYERVEMDEEEDVEDEGADDVEV